MSGNVAIIGGGLAGTACAYVLGNAGYTPVIFEAGDSLASGASGNWTGLYNPRFYAEFSPEAQFYAEGFLSVSKLFSEIGEEIDHSAHGSLHLITTDDKKRRFEKMLESWGWQEDQMKLVCQTTASEISGIEITHEGLFLPTSGTISAPKLCAFYAKGADVRLKVPVIHLEQRGEGWRVNEEDFDIVILACGAGVRAFPQTQWLPVYTVRGQIIKVRTDAQSRDLKCNLNYGGYVTPETDGAHVLGSTFQKWLTDTSPRIDDNDYILQKLKEAVPALSAVNNVIDGRASLRTSSQDRLPLIGAVTNHQAFEGENSNIPNLYLSTAHGSHGIVTSYAAANMILQEITGGEKSPCADALSPSRFLKRMLRKDR